MEKKNQMENVLDHITGASVFVMAQDSHEILYVNDRLRKVRPFIQLGDICEDVWNCGCRNCPGCLMGERESSFITSYDMPFGKFVDMSATKIMWNDEIPACLVSISNHMMEELDQEKELGRQQMQIAVSQIYTMVISVNLTQNTYFMVEYAGFDSHCAPVSGTFDSLIESGAATMHPDYQEAFVEKFSRSSLLKLYGEGGRSRYMEHLQMGDDGSYHWTDTHVIRIENPYSEDIMQISLSRNIDDQKAMEEQIRNAVLQQVEVSKRFAISIRNMYDDIYEADLVRGEIYNFRYEDTGLARVLMDKSYRELVEEIAEEQVCPECREKYLENMSVYTLQKHLLEEEKQVYFEYRREKTGGECHWYSNLIQLVSENQNDFRIMIFARDINAIRNKDEQKKQELQKALEEAKSANRVKADFISRMSHDIRTPINAIMGMSAIASASPEDSGKVGECLEKIGLSARFLLSMINDILDMSRIESGKLVIVEKEFRFRELMQEITSMITVQVQEKKQELHISIEENVAEAYLGDAMHLKQILLNLLSNAIQFTREEGRISLTARQTEKNGEQAVLKIQVEDNGIGMSEEFQKVLFEPFEQENATEGRVFESSGLGLSITRNLVQLMGGTIEFESKIAEGTTFEVELPFKITEEFPRREAEVTEVEPEGFQGQRVLVVEDNDINLEIVQTILEGWNLVVDAAENGLVALEKFRASRPGWYRLILMDIRMPVMDGLTATRKIRGLNREDAGTVPIMALTANASQEDSRYAASIGMNEYLTKPVEMKLLYRKIKEFFCR